MSSLRSAALVAALGALALLGLWALRPAAPEPEPPPPYTLRDGRVIFAPDAKILHWLEVVEVGRAAAESAEFRTVGQIIALSNPSGSLTEEGVGWVELDAQLTAAAELKLDGGQAAGTAYGVTNLAAEYAARVEVGQTIEIARYGLKKSRVPAEIVRVLHRPGDGADVVFRFEQAQDWFPGTNCEIAFPMLRGRPVRIPTTAPVHEGTQEYVWKQVAPGEFAAQDVSVVDATPDAAAVLGLEPGDRIVARGAILLKPLLKPLLARKGG